MIAIVLCYHFQLLLPLLECLERLERTNIQACIANALVFIFPFWKAMWL
jgi:hypothetical protein